MDLLTHFRLLTGGLISAILRRQSASVSCGPETKVPLTLVEYQPAPTPRRSDSSVLTCRGERFCMDAFSWHSRRLERREVFQLSRRTLIFWSAFTGEPGKARKHRRNQIAVMRVGGGKFRRIEIQ